MANPASKARDDIVLSARINGLIINAPEDVTKNHVDEIADDITSNVKISKKIEATFKCHVCNASYQRHGNLKTHLKTQHNIDEKLVLACENCEKVFDTVKRLNRHKKSCL